LPGPVVAACSSKPAEPPAPPAPEPLTLPADPANYAPNPLVGPMTIPADNPMTVDKATLGWQLWFDKRLSGKGDRSCYGCHVNEKGLDRRPGEEHERQHRHAAAAPHADALEHRLPHRVVLGRPRQDARRAGARGVEAGQHGRQGPMVDKVQDAVIARINAVPSYAAQFKKVFGAPADEKNVTQALATYMRTIVSKETRTIASRPAMRQR
jgi:cytochrome c peroxidase